MRILSKSQVAWRRLWNSLNKPVEVLPPDSLIDQAVSDGRLKLGDPWTSARDLVKECGERWAFPSFTDEYFRDVMEYVELMNLRVETVSELISAIHMRNGRK